MEWLFNKKRWQSNIPEIIFLNSDNCVSRHLLKLSDKLFRSLYTMGLKSSWFKIIGSFLPRLKRNGNFCFCNHQAGSIIFSMPHFPSGLTLYHITSNVQYKAFRLMGYHSFVLWHFALILVHILWLLDELSFEHDRMNLWK